MRAGAFVPGTLFVGAFARVWRAASSSAIAVSSASSRSTSSASSRSTTKGSSSMGFFLDIFSGGESVFVGDAFCARRFFLLVCVIKGVVSIGLASLRSGKRLCSGRGEWSIGCSRRSLSLEGGGRHALGGEHARFVPTATVI